MVSVALIGADGAGKTTLARSLERRASLPIKYVYMGANPRQGDHALPTTRLLCALRRALSIEPAGGGPPDPAARRARPATGLRGMASRLRSALALLNRLAEEWHRVRVARRWERRGRLVLFDRHCFADYWAHDLAGDGRSLAQRLHGRFLRSLPRPDCTILLDAPAEVLFARKPEGTLERVALRRQEYLDLRRSDRSVVVVDASRPRGVVEREVLELLQRLARGGRP